MKRSLLHGLKSTDLCLLSSFISSARHIIGAVSVMYDLAMRIRLYVPALFLLVLTVSAQTAPDNAGQETADEQTGYCPHTHSLESRPSAQYWLHGVIGSKAVKMYLDRGGSGVVGLFYDTKSDWTPVFLGGTWKPEGLDLSASVNSSAFDREASTPLGRLQGQLVGKVLLGHWTPAGSEHVEPIHLSVVPKTGCAVKGEWTRFESPKWPFSFSYPASWKLVEEKQGNDEHIRFICPDPEEMAYDADVTLSEGLGAPAPKTGLVRCAEGWRYDAECGDDIEHSASSHIPVQTGRPGLRILDLSDREWRLSCRGGDYVGQTDGTDVVVLLQKGWVSITAERSDRDTIERIANSICPRRSK